MTDTAVESLELAAQIVSAHVSKNTVEAHTLPSLIQEICKALISLMGGVGGQAEAEKPVPAIPIKKSVFADYIICLENGKKLKMLKRHLQSSYNMTPDQYRERWGLPRDYPMVAPSYAERRSDLAKEIGLGRKVETPGEPPRRGRAKTAKAAD